MKRREFLAGAAAVAACVSQPSASLAQTPSTLRQKAQAKGLVFGSAVGSQHLLDAPFAGALASDAGILVHEYELKRKNVEPKPGSYTFGGADRIMQFAKRNNQLVRGHTLVWHAANPDWLEEDLGKGTRADHEKLMTTYITTVMRRYSGRMHSWDVVNEPVDLEDWSWNGMRTSSPWYKALGEEYIDIAFRAARELAPDTPLYLNDYSVENDARWNEKRRVAVLKLLERLKARGVPLDGFGIQGHLKVFRDKFSEPVFHKFLSELEGMGLKLMITEMDAADADGPDDPGKRDAEIAAVVRSFLDVSLASPSMTGVLTWGMSDKYSWLSSAENYKRRDNTPARGLPYDADMVKKPMWNAIAAAFDAAPARSPVP